MPPENKTNKYKYLFKINSPEDLRKLPVTALQDVCNEVRDFMVDTITKTGGHFGAGLGVVELTVALHYIYDTPKDKIIFDVGHQGYPHKIITGRRDLLHTIRRKTGLSGFLKPSESEYDVFGAGHASTSISAALGIATARDMLNKKFRVIAVIGDGALTGGMSFEAMNNCGVLKKDITVILNDNNISISQNVSALSNYFNEVFASATVQKIRESIWELTGKMDQLGDRIRLAASRIEGGLMSIITPGMLFEALGFKYFGPINGNNIRQLIRMLNFIKDVKGPILLHIITQKGKGYGPAERDSLHLHAIGKIDKTTGKSIYSTAEDNGTEKYQDIFASAMLELFKMNPKIVGITAAMVDGTGLDSVELEYPDRIFDVGIAEQHAITFAAGLANQGIIPICAVYSTFLQRAYDQIIHDCALQKLHVIFAIDRAGIVGEDGATHHGVMDLAYLRSIPNMIVMAPKDEQELRDMLYSAVFQYTQGPVAIRYPRGAAMGAKIEPMKLIPLGQAEIMRNGEDIALLAIGKMTSEALIAAQILEENGISAEVVNARFVKPLDAEMLDYLCNKFDNIITIEDGQALGGFGSAVMEYIGGNYNRKVDVLIHGIPDKFIEHGTQSELLHELKLDGEGIAEVAMEFIKNKEENLLEKVLHAHN